MAVFENQRLIDGIEERLDRLSQRIKTFSGTGLNDPAKFLEPFAARLLNLVYGWQLTDPDPGVPNTKAVDLIDDHQKVAVQVSIQESATKISHTKDMLSDGRLADFNVIAVFFLHHKKYQNNHGLRIINIGTLIGDLIGRPVSFLNQVAALLDEELGELGTLSSQRGQATAPPRDDKWARREADDSSIGAVATPHLGDSLDGSAPFEAHPPAISIQPFVAIADAVELFGDETNPALFAPSRREFIENEVHRSQVAGSVEAKLIKERFACVLGKGASGKTTLAILLAHSAQFGASKSFYCDLARMDEPTDAAQVCIAISAIQQKHSRDALVIVDNIHIAEQAAHRIHIHGWRDADRPVRLLFLGRFVQKQPAQRGNQSTFAALQQRAITLAVESSDLIGVLDRLFRRTGKQPAVRFSPLDSHVQEWMKIFGGELIAFSAAARRRLSNLCRGDYALTADDAADYVRSEYLCKDEHPITKEEQENLIALAATTELELFVPVESLPFPDHLETSARCGLVLHFAFGLSGTFCGYHFAHPGLGDLLWTAADSSRSRVDYQAALATKHPWIGSRIVYRLAEVKGDKAAAKSVLGAITARSDCFDQIATCGLSWLHTDCYRVLEFGVLSAAELDGRLCASGQVVETALDAPLHFLRRFLDFAKRRLPRTFEAIAANLKNNPEQLLAKPLLTLRSFLEYADGSFPELSQAVGQKFTNHQSALIQCCLVAPLSDLRHFLEYSDRKLPALTEAIGNGLLSHSDQVLHRVRSTPLHLLGNFLRYAEAQLPALTRIITDELNTDPHQLLPSARETPLDMLGKFLLYAESHMPKLTRAIVTDLNDNMDSVVQLASRTPVLELRHFLQYAGDHLPELAQNIVRGLIMRRNELVGYTRHASLGQLQRFLEYADEAMPEVAIAIVNDLKSHPDRLIQRALGSPAGGLRRFLRYAERRAPDVVVTITNGFNTVGKPIPKSDSPQRYKNDDYRLPSS